jgi:hypothetical protein
LKTTLLILFAIAFADRVSAANVSVESLIVSLAETSSSSAGVDPFAMYDGFIANPDTLRFSVGVLGAPPPVVAPEMRELVARGLDSVPRLIAHISDPTPTKLRVGDGVFMWRVLSNEYDPKDRNSKRKPHRNEERPLGPGYVVKIGDICYSLLGQIVNRRLIAVRYQPTAGLVVNSPVETPMLATLSVRDWGSLDRNSHVSSLTRDAKRAHDVYEAAPALARLAFYYPEEYARLKRGTLKRIIAKYEQQEQATSQ